MESHLPRKKVLGLNPPRSDCTLIGLLRSGLVMRSHTKPAIAMPTHSQVKKLNRLMTEKISCEMAYIIDRTHYCKAQKFSQFKFMSNHIFSILNFISTIVVQTRKNV